MLEISATMNSAVEDIFAFKTCCGMHAFDQNLEILIKNRGIYPIVVPSYCDLCGRRGTRRITTLMPNGDQKILPGEIKAFYATMDDVLWNETSQLIFYDTKGNPYPVAISHQGRD